MFIPFCVLLVDVAMIVSSTTLSKLKLTISHGGTMKSWLWWSPLKVR